MFSAAPAGPLPSVPDGDSYNVEWVDGQKHSSRPVVYRWRDGSEYTGPFFRDAMEGEGGTFMSANGAVYRGGFRDNQFHGPGKLIESNGDVYEGTTRLCPKHHM